MEQASPARLFATLTGTALVIYGIAGFLLDSSFARPGDAGEAAGLLEINGWANTVHIVTGALGLLLASFASRRYAIGICSLYGMVAVATALA